MLWPASVCDADWDQPNGFMVAQTRSIRPDILILIAHWFIDECVHIMKILHIGQSYPFVGYAIEALNAHLKAEVVAYVTPLGDRAGNFAIPQERSRLEVWPKNAIEKRIRAVKLARSADVIVAHALNGIAALAISANPSAVSVWSGWGVDYYHDAFSNSELLGPLTQRAIDAASGLAILKQRALFRLRSHAARHINLYCAPIATDAQVMQRAFPALRGDVIEMPYLEVSRRNESVSVSGGPDILVGNSATPTCNHLETFELLRQHDLSGRLVIVPLTYGEATYRETVIREGFRMFGSQFFPIRDHMPELEYFKVMGRCGTAIFNHRRQQAMGNIIVALQKGMAVYLDDANPVSGWLHANGLKAYSTKDLVASPPQNELTEHDHKRNLQAIQKIWGHAAVSEKYANAATCIRVLADQGS